jgi:hypothetical protein
MRHARFSPQLGEKPREFNVLLRTHAPQQMAALFDHLVGAGEQRNVEAASHYRVSTGAVE